MAPAEPLQRKHPHGWAVHGGSSLVAGNGEEHGERGEHMLAYAGGTVEEGKELVLFEAALKPATVC